MRRIGTSYLLVLAFCSVQLLLAQQLPSQAAAISQQCRPYTGSLCAGIVDYPYLAKDQEGLDPETAVKETLKRVEVCASHRDSPSVLS